MPGLTYSSPSGKRESESEEEEEGEEEESATPATSNSPHLRAPSKRVRLNDGSPSPASSQGSSGNDETASPELNDVANRPHSDPAAFKPGSIFRISFNNFVTYTEADFYPGPSLNMILGPNGTGKSTFVCAICLGLNFPTKLLGRPKDASEYVKYGAAEASVEIELVKKPGQRRNPIIRRRIIKETRKSVWSLNGKVVPQRDITACVESFSIQIDNLCQFLPQDKVADFARMDPIELLNSTQKAVAEPEMAEMHESLKKLGKERKDTQEKVFAETKQLNSLKQRQEAVQRDVDRLHERVQLQQHIKRLEYGKICVDCAESKTNYDQAGEAVKSAQRDMAELKQQVEPKLAELKTKTKYKKVVQKVIDNAKAEVTKKNDQSTAIKTKFDEHAQTIMSNGLDMRAKEKTIGDSKRKIDTLRRKISHMENQLTGTQPVCDTASFNERIRAEDRKIQKFEEDGAEVKSGINELKSQGNEAKDKRDKAQESLNSLSTQIGKQSQVLGNISKDALKAWQWIQNNQDEFEQPILGPPAIVCSITDPLVAPQIESLFNKLDFCTFTCQSKNDFKKLHQILKVDQRLSYIQCREVRRTVQTFKSPLSREALKQMNGDGWAIDFMQGPDLVLGLLCEQNRLHSTAVMKNEITPDQHKRIERSELSSWVDPKSKYTILRRKEYGPGAVSTRVDPIRNAIVWTEQELNRSIAQEHEDDIRRYGGQFEELKQKFQAENARLHQMGSQRLEAMDQKKALENEKEALQKAAAQFRMLPDRIDQDKVTVESEINLIREVRAEKADHEEKKKQLLIDHVELARDYAASITSLRQAHEQLYLAELTLMEARADEASLQEQNKSVTDSLEELQKGIADLTTTRATLKAKTKELYRDVQSLTKELHERGEHDTLTYLNKVAEETTSQQLAEDIATEKERLQLNDNDDPQLLEQYERRKDSIERHTKQAEEFRDQFEKLEMEIRSIRSIWEPRLDELVAQISAAFSKSFEDIGCAGQVSVGKDDDDYSQWAIFIDVKFRESEELTRLTAQRQSGGERAVTTIFYLMSLQRLTQSPFRVVDEINQGMDQRNERTVHEQMVKIACEGDTSQYFLITPKLLTGLKYHSKMRVHVIASGEYMPTDPKRIDFRNCVDIALRVKSGF